MRGQAIREEVDLNCSLRKEKGADYLTKRLPKEYFKTRISKVGMNSPKVELSASLERIALLVGKPPTISDRIEPST